MIFRCPVCAAALASADGVRRCPAGHCYDIAKEGYVNLLLAQQRRSSDPGYSKEMIAGRRDFFDAGHYQRLADGVADEVLRRLPDTQRPVVLDAGCGEGYYLRRLRSAAEQQGRDLVRAGLDISKHGVRVAARRDAGGHYAVAGSFGMPVLADSVDVLITHFSPVSTDDFAGVLRPGGVVLVGGPGVDHLYEFKELLYDRPEHFQPTDQLAEEDGFEPLDSVTIRYPLRLRGPGQVANLLLMTPYYWTVDAATRDRLAARDTLDVTVDVRLRAYQYR